LREERDQTGFRREARQGAGRGRGVRYLTGKNLPGPNPRGEISALEGALQVTIVWHYRASALSHDIDR
jgi:hypothetical protein